MPYVIEQFERQARKEIIFAKDIPVMRKDGGVFYADVNSFPIKIAGRAYLVGIFRDITERKLAEEKIRESESCFRGLVENSPIGIWQDSADQRTVYANKAILDMLEIENPDEITDKNWQSFFTQESLDIIEREHKRRYEGTA